MKIFNIFFRTFTIALLLPTTAFCCQKFTYPYSSSGQFTPFTEFQSRYQCENSYKGKYTFLSLWVNGEGRTTEVAVGYCLFNCYVAGVLPDSPSPQACVANPIEIGLGSKIQEEHDIYAAGEGQIAFKRFYNSSAASKWGHSYGRGFVEVDPKIDSSLRMKGQYRNTKQEACDVALAMFKNANPNEAWATGTTAISAGGSCSITRNGVAVKALPIFSAEPEQPSGAIQLSRPNGSTLAFQFEGTSFVSSIDGDQGTLQKLSSGVVAWRYVSKTGEIEDYSVNGKLIYVTSANGMKQTLTYDSVSGLLSRVKDATGRQLDFAYANNRLASVTVDVNQTTSYTYNTAGLITDVTRPDNTHRLYHYEDTRFPTYLTGITDERGVRYATWTYDAQGRAISSEHAGGAEKTLLAFNADSSTTVTNALGKKTIYRFADITGARRVVKVEGQPTTNCVGANQNYTYTPEGWVASKTDWKGIKTTFTYNTQGQEITRVEAFGTPEARTIKTEWHPTFGLKTKVTEFDNETVYTYDVNGLLTNQNMRYYLKRKGNSS